MKGNIFKYYFFITGIFNLNTDSFGQEIISPSGKRSINLMAGVQVFDHTNGGPYLLTNYPDDINTAIDEILALPMLSVSFGIKFKNIFQILDFSHKKRSGLYSMGLGRDYINLKYFSYHFWYDFMDKYKFPVKPLISFSSSFVIKNYYFSKRSDFSNGSDRVYRDNSKSILFQLPVGLYFNNKKILISFSYNLNILAFINGNYEYRLTSYYAQQVWSTFSEFSTYSGSSMESDYQKQKNIFNLRMCFTINPNRENNLSNQNLLQKLNIKPNIK